jgi:hypothetical protein
MRCGIIIPYRDREDHLRQSAPILKQYGHVYVIEQMDKNLFNRGKLINVGYLSFKQEFDYFAAHDVDMVPEDVNYAYAENPCHLATQVEQFGYKMPYGTYFGGVTLFPNDKFEKINGFYNSMWGYGGEDDLVRKKILELAMPIQSRQCRFQSLHHLRIIDRDARMKNAERLRAPIDWEDGLSSCEYEVVHCEDKEHYTLCQVKI